MRYLVVDQNMMRSTQLHRMVSSDPSVCFILPDAAIREMAKGGHFGATAQRSLSVFCGASHRTYFAIDSGEAISMESRSLTAATKESWLDGSLTAAGRKLICRLRDEEYLDALTREVASENPSNVFIDGNVEKTKLVNQLKILKEHHGEFCKSVRSGAISGLALLEILRVLSGTIPLGMAPHPLLRTEGCATWRYVFLLLRSIVLWETNRGIECAAPKAIANDAYDREYALVASYFDGILTKDKGAQSVFGDLNLVLGIPVVINAGQTMLAARKLVTAAPEAPTCHFLECEQLEDVAPELKFGCVRLHIT